jgi:hypothetical protein
MKKRTLVKPGGREQMKVDPGTTQQNLRRDRLVSVMYAEELNSTKSSVALQRTDRHGIVDEESSEFQLVSLNFSLFVERKTWLRSCESPLHCRANLVKKRGALSRPARAHVYRLRPTTNSAKLSEIGLTRQGFSMIGIEHHGEFPLTFLA